MFAVLVAFSAIVIFAPPAQPTTLFTVLAFKKGVFFQRDFQIFHHIPMEKEDAHSTKPAVKV